MRFLYAVRGGVCLVSTLSVSTLSFRLSVPLAAQTPPPATADVVDGQGGRFTTNTTSDEAPGAGLRGPHSAAADNGGNLHAAGAGNGRAPVLPGGAAWFAERVSRGRGISL
jgi:hypothetical protein